MATRGKKSDSTSVGWARRVATAFKDLQATTKGAWTEEEVERLYAAMASGGEENGKRPPWSVIASKVGTRTAQQCRLKYQKDTGEKKELWTRQDDRLLLHSLYEVGAETFEDVPWTEIATSRFPSRTGNELRTRFRSLKKQSKATADELQFSAALEAVRRFTEERLAKLDDGAESGGVTGGPIAVA